jgi:hypothetical protein
MPSGPLSLYDEPTDDGGSSSETPASE